MLARMQHWTLTVMSNWIAMTSHQPDLLTVWVPNHQGKLENVTEFDLPGKSGKLKNWLENQGKYGITHRWVENVPVQISDTFQNYKQHVKCVDEKKIKSQNVEIICAGVANYGEWCAFSTEMCGSIGQGMLFN